MGKVIIISFKTRKVSMRCDTFKRSSKAIRLSVSETSLVTRKFFFLFFFFRFLFIYDFFFHFADEFVFFVVLYFSLSLSLLFSLIFSFSSSSYSPLISCLLSYPPLLSYLPYIFHSLTKNFHAKLSCFLNLLH